MANSKHTSLRKSRIVENRNQRDGEPVQPGASARGGRNTSPEQAEKIAKGTVGKTSKHASRDVE